MLYGEDFNLDKSNWLLRYVFEISFKVEDGLYGISVDILNYFLKILMIYKI